MPKSVKNAKVLLLDAALEIEKTETITEIIEKTKTEIKPIEEHEYKEAEKREEIPEERELGDKVWEDIKREEKSKEREQKIGNFLTNSPSGKSQIKGKKIVVCQALGTRRSKIFYKNFEELGELENIQKPFSIIIPSKLHFLEKEFLESFE